MHRGRAADALKDVVEINFLFDQSGEVFSHPVRVHGVYIRMLGQEGQPRLKSRATAAWP